MSKKIHSPDSNYKIQLIFPVPIHIVDVSDYGGIRNKLIQFVYDEMERDPKGTLVSNKGGWQSKSFKIDRPDNLLHSTIAKAVGGIPCFREGIETKIHGWMNVNGVGDYNRSHVHPGCDLSGILYIKCAKNSGKVVFDSPYTFSAWREIFSYSKEFRNKTNYYNLYKFHPLEGRMIVFPSHLRHCVEENESDEDRISIAFNLNLSDK